MDVLIVFIASLLGGFTQTVAGFGCGIVIMLFLPYILPIMRASGLNVLITMVLNVMLVIKYRKSVNMRLVLAPAGISFIVSTICIYVGTNLNLDSMKIIFSLFLIALAIYFIFFSERIKLEPNVGTVLTCASLAGAANGLFGIGGPPMALYFLTITKGKEEYIGTSQAYFLLTCVYTTIIRIISGVFDRHLMMLTIPGVLAILIGEFIGIRVVDKISHKKLKQVIYYVLVISGVITLVQCMI